MTTKTDKKASLFAERLEQAIDSHPLAPDGKHGRITWLRNRLEDLTGLKVSINTVHKWVNGYALPRQEKAIKLAKILAVDPVWLTLGHRPVASLETRQDAVRRASGAVLLLAGIIEVGGGRVAFPEPEDNHADQRNVHLYTISDGRQIRITAGLGKAERGEIVFAVPQPVNGNKVIGVYKNPHADWGHHTLVDLTGLEGESHGGYLEIRMPCDRRGVPEVVPITSLRELAE